MKPILAFSFSILVAMASPAAAAGNMTGGTGNMKPKPGNMGGSRMTSPYYGAKPLSGPGSLSPNRYGATSPIGSTSSTGSLPPLGPERFKPYKGDSVYSNRGGVNAYPKPAKPKGYINPYGKSGF